MITYRDKQDRLIHNYYKFADNLENVKNSIIIKGLNDKDKVITTGHAFVRDGDVVRANIVGVK